MTEQNWQMPPLAYLNEEYLKSPDARIFRILAEYGEPASRLRRFNVRDTIVFFGSARSIAPEIAQAQLDKLKLNNDTSPEHQNAVERAEHAVRLSRY